VNRIDAGVSVTAAVIFRASLVALVGPVYLASSVWFADSLVVDEEVMTC
jgi:hypothetical protein